MKKLILLFVVMMMAMGMLMGCEPSDPGTTALIASESFLTSEVRIVQEPAISKIENAKLGVPTPLGCKVVPNNLKSKMVWVVAPMDGVSLSFNKDNRMVHMTITQVAKYSVTCALETTIAEFSVIAEGYVEPVDPPAPPATEPPAIEPPALDPPVELPEEPVMWEACPEGSSGTGCLTGKPAMFTWAQAFERCAALREKGYSDWRVPAANLLQTLCSYAKFPCADLVKFPRTPAGSFWASESAVIPTTAAWGVRFDAGSVIGADKLSGRYVRCVRGGQSLEASSFQRSSSPEPTVLNNRTGTKYQGCLAGLTGENCGAGGMLRVPQAEAAAYCAALTWNGETGWRLPTASEQESLVDKGSYYPAADGDFMGMREGDETWTGTMRAVSEGFVVDFRFGVLRSQLSSRPCYFRCAK